MSDEFLEYLKYNSFTIKSNLKIIINPKSELAKNELFVFSLISLDEDSISYIPKMYRSEFNNTFNRFCNVIIKESISDKIISKYQSEVIDNDLINRVHQDLILAITNYTKNTSLEDIFFRDYLLI